MKFWPRISRSMSLKHSRHKMPAVTNSSTRRRASCNRAAALKFETLASADCPAIFSFLLICQVPCPAAGSWPIVYALLGPPNISLTYRNEKGKYHFALPCDLRIMSPDVLYSTCGSRRNSRRWYETGVHASTFDQAIDPNAGLARLVFVQRRFAALQHLLASSLFSRSQENEVRARWRDSHAPS